MMCHSDPVSIRQLFGALRSCVDAGRQPPDVHVGRCHDGVTVFYRNQALGVFPSDPTLAQIERALRDHFRAVLEVYLLGFFERLGQRLVLPGDASVTYSLDHELMFFDADDSTTHLFLIGGSDPFPVRGEVRLHSHLAKASLSLVAENGALESSLLSESESFVFGDTLDEMVEGIAAKIEQGLSRLRQAA